MLTSPSPPQPGDFPFPDLNPFLPTTPPTTAIASPLQPPPYPTPLYNAHPASPNFNLTTSYPGHQPHQSSGSRSTSPTTQDLSAAANNETPAARLAAEEDKRRRNTAASARFRVKKKQREQALEQTAKDLENKTLALEQRIRQLETENEWLRVLVVEKNGGEKADLKVRWERVGGVEGGGERRGEKGKKGVGTEEKGEGEA